MKNAARKLEYWLRSAGHQPWRDKSQLVPGRRWTRDIEKAIRECDVMVAILSGASYESANCEDEHLLARDLRKPIIPAVLPGDVHVPMYFFGPVRVPFVEDNMISALLKNGFPGKHYSPAIRNILIVTGERHGLTPRLFPASAE